MFAPDLNTGSGNLSELNEIDVLIGHCTCAAWKNSAGSVGSKRHGVAGLGEVDAHLSGTDRDAACVNTPALSVKLAAPGLIKLSM